ncbi:MAG: hypothetical protein WD512_19170 [Candidatus Paceibacterota bacterium]
MSSIDYNLDVESLLKTLDNDDNHSLMKLDNSKIKAIKNDVLQKLHFKKDDIKIILKKIKEYRFVDELDDLHYGSYIRWINLTNPSNLKLTNGGVICAIKIINGSVLITCKNNMNRMFSLRMDENLIFQKLNNNEKVLLSVLDYVSK